MKVLDLKNIDPDTDGFHKSLEPGVKIEFLEDFMSRLQDEDFTAIYDLGGFRAKQCIKYDQLELRQQQKHMKPLNHPMKQKVFHFA